MNAPMHNVEGSLETRPRGNSDTSFTGLYLSVKALCKSIFAQRSYYVERGGCFTFIGVHFPFPPRTVTLQRLRFSRESLSPVLESLPPLLLQKGATILLIRAATSTSQKFAGNFQLDTNPRPKCFTPHRPPKCKELNPA